jgi:hypothetical protein
MAVTRYNLNAYDSGEEYLSRLNSETERNFKILLSLLSSYWQSTVDGPNYARELKTIAIELSKLKISLSDVQQDTNFLSTRSEYVYQVLTSMLFPKEKDIPDLGVSNEDFRTFLVKLISLYFTGSVPSSLESAVNLLTSQKVVITENYKREDEVGFDISNQFGFDISLILNNASEVNTILSDKNVRILMSILKPAHTLYRIKNILQDEYTGAGNKTDNPFTLTSTNKIKDESRFGLSNYGYESFKKSVYGVDGVDEAGSKKPVVVLEEDHTWKISDIPNVIGIYDSESVADGTNIQITSWAPSFGALPSLISMSPTSGPYKNGSLWSDGVRTVNFSSPNQWLYHNNGLANAFKPGSNWTIIVVGEFAGTGSVVWGAESYNGGSGFHDLASECIWDSVSSISMDSVGSPLVSSVSSPLSARKATGPSLCAWSAAGAGFGGTGKFAVRSSGYSGTWSDGDNQWFISGKGYSKTTGGIGVQSLSHSGFSGRIRNIVIMSRVPTEFELDLMASYRNVL